MKFILVISINLKFVHIFVLYIYIPSKHLDFPLQHPYES